MDDFIAFVVIAIAAPVAVLGDDRTTQNHPEKKESTQSTMLLLLPLLLLESTPLPFMVSFQ